MFIQSSRLQVALRTNGRPIFLSVQAFSSLEPELSEFIQDALLLSGAEDVEFIQALQEMDDVGSVLITESEKLSLSDLKSLSDHLKLLGESEDSSKVVVVGSVESLDVLIDASPDLVGRAEIIL